MFTVGDNLALFLHFSGGFTNFQVVQHEQWRKGEENQKVFQKNFARLMLILIILKENAFLLKQLREVLAVVFVVCGYVFIIFHLRAVVFVFFLFFLFFLISPWLCFLDFP